jgi:hypothetical protein
MTICNYSSQNLLYSKIANDLNECADPSECVGVSNAKLLTGLGGICVG